MRPDVSRVSLWIAFQLVCGLPLMTLLACGPPEGRSSGVVSDPVLLNSVQGAWKTNCREMEFLGADRGIGPLFEHGAIPVAANQSLAIAGERMTVRRIYFSDLDCLSPLVSIQENAEIRLPGFFRFSVKKIRVTWKDRHLVPTLLVTKDWNAEGVCGRRSWVAGESFRVIDHPCGDSLGPSVDSTWEYAFNAVTGALYMDGQTYFRY